MGQCIKLRCRRIRSSAVSKDEWDSLNIRAPSVPLPELHARRLVVSPFWLEIRDVGEGAVRVKDPARNDANWVVVPR
jgi:hypothetical protein